MSTLWGVLDEKRGRRERRRRGHSLSHSACFNTHTLSLSLLTSLLTSLSLDLSLSLFVMLLLTLAGWLACFVLHICSVYSRPVLCVQLAGSFCRLLFKRSGQRVQLTSSNIFDELPISLHTSVLARAAIPELVSQATKDTVSCFVCWLFGLAPWLVLSLVVTQLWPMASMRGGQCGVVLLLLLPLPLPLPLLCACAAV